MFAKGQLSCLKFCRSPTFDCICPLSPKDSVCKPKLCFQVLQHKHWHFHPASPLGQSNSKNPTFRAVDWTKTPHSPHLREGEARVPAHFPGDVKKQTHLGQISELCVCLTTGVIPLLRMGPQPAPAVCFILWYYSSSKAESHIHTGPQKLLAFEVAKAPISAQATILALSAGSSW